MCLARETEPRQLKRDRHFWKVFIKLNALKQEFGPARGIRYIHCSRPVVKNKLTSKKRFAERFGFQVFNTERKARDYAHHLGRRNYPRRELPEYPYKIKKVLVRRGALFCKGVIKNGFIHARRVAYRVSSLEILGEVE